MKRTKIKPPMISSIIPYSFFFFLFSFFLLHSQEPFSGLKEARQISDTLKITLQEAILLGLENNPTVTIRRLNPDIASTFAEEERAAFDPVLSAGGQKSEGMSQRRLGAQRTPFDLKDKRYDYTLRLSEKLPSGTLLDLSAGMTGSVSNLYTDQYSGGLELTVTQSLLKGFGWGAGLASLRRARLNVDISRAELKGIAESVTGQIEKSYWDLYLAEKETAIQRQSLELARQQLSESLERVNVGKLPELELAAVEAEVASRHGALIDAYSRCEQARLRFLYLLNPKKDSIWTQYPVPLNKPFLPADTLDTIDVHEQLGMTYRPDLQQARLAYRQGELDLSFTRNGLLPRLDVFVSLGRTTYSESFDNSYPDISSPFYQAVAGVTFELPIPNREAAARLKRARFSLEQQALALNNMEKIVQLDVRSAYVEVLRSRQQITATRVTRELQERNLAAELEKFRVGKSTNFLVLQVQRDYTTSQLDEARAMVVYLTALVDLYIAEGTLLERRGIHGFDE